jgi:hypothetical protein
MAKTIVKHWFGSSNDSSKATFREFKTKKEALEYVKRERWYTKVHGHEMWGNANFYEVFSLKDKNV